MLCCNIIISKKYKGGIVQMKKSFILAVILCILLTGCGKNVSEFEGENDAINTQVGDKTEVNNTENGVEQENYLMRFFYHMI